jgi:hypothetical protein
VEICAGSWVGSEKPFATKIVLFPLNDEESTTSGKIDIEAGRSIVKKLEAEFAERSVKKGAADAFDSILPKMRALARECCSGAG